MSDPYSHSQPYSTGRGFVHLTEAETKELRKERTVGKGGLGIRYNEWSQLPNATGEIMRGVSSNYDWRNYSPKPISGFSKVASQGRKFGPAQELAGAAKSGYRGTGQAGTMEPQGATEYPAAPTAFTPSAESRILPAGRPNTGMGADAPSMVSSPSSSIWPATQAKPLNDTPTFASSRRTTSNNLSAQQMGAAAPKQLSMFD